MSDWYKYGDKLYVQLVVKVERIFRQQRLKLRFDELNVLSSRSAATKIYTQLRTLNRKAYCDLCTWLWEDELLEARAALEAAKKHQKQEPVVKEEKTRKPAEVKPEPAKETVPYRTESKPDISDLPKMTHKEAYEFLDEFMSDINPVTRTIPENDEQRDQDMFFESTAIDVDTGNRKAWEDDFARAERKWLKHTKQNLIDVEDSVRRRAAKQAGATKVMWHTEQDDRVCAVCDPLDGRIFDIDAVPPKQHINCRCWWTVVG